MGHWRNIRKTMVQTKVEMEMEMDPGGWVGRSNGGMNKSG